jgi:hypothetical protein
VEVQDIIINNASVREATWLSTQHRKISNSHSGAINAQTQREHQVYQQYEWNKVTGAQYEEERARTLGLQGQLDEKTAKFDRSHPQEARSFKVLGFLFERLPLHMNFGDSNYIPRNGFDPVRVTFCTDHGPASYS